MKGVIPMASLQDATLSDDFLFSYTMRDEAVCKAFLEALLGKTVTEIHYLDREVDMTDSFSYHGIRLDVYVEAEDATYNIEMQNVNRGALERRCRYYQAGIDRHLLKKGANYRDLPESYIIFVCNFDYYGLGRMVYERQQGIKGTDLAYNDGSHVLILNANYDRALTAENQPLGEFLQLLNSHSVNPESDLAKLTEQTISKIKANDEMEEEYMTLGMLLAETREDSLREGRQEGRQEGQKEGAVAQAILSVKAIMKKLQVSIEEAAAIAGVPDNIRDMVLEAVKQDSQP